MIKQIFQSLKCWFFADTLTDSESFAIDWVRVFPFLVLHAACLSVFWVGISWIAVGVAFLLSMWTLSRGASRQRFAIRDAYVHTAHTERKLDRRKGGCVG